MPFSLAKELAESVQRLAPQCAFVAFPEKGSYVYPSPGKENICWNEESKTFVVKMPPSYGPYVGDMQLGTLAFQAVFETREEPNEVKRSRALSDRLSAMLPQHAILVAVIDKEVSESPFVTGPTKALAFYTDPYLGSHIFILLT